MWERVKKEALEFVKLMPWATLVILGWELGKLFF